MKYYKDIDDIDERVIIAPIDEANTLEQWLKANPNFTIEVTEAEWEEYKLPSIKAEKCLEINERTDELIAEGFDHNEVHFDLKQEDQLNINTLFNMMNAGISMTGQYFRGSEEDYHFINNADFILLVSEGNNVKTQAIESGAELKNAVNACTTIAGVDAIEDDR